MKTTKLFHLLGADATSSPPSLSPLNVLVLHAFSRHPALFPLANALIPSMSHTATRYAKNRAVSAVNAPGPM
jgi:hypothetical protein